MPSAKDLQAELRALRKDHVKPVSRMRVADISAEIQALKGHREETPAVAAVPSAPIKKSRAAVENIKDAVTSEFTMKPETSKKGSTGTAKAASEKKKSRLARLLEMMEDDDE
tara:strand:- start:146 stop:481 length:336 start_codon:yes stop_codon:yes gene_type:complete